MTSPISQIVLAPASRAWRRRLGPLAWAVLEELAQQASPAHDGWVAAIGVRDLGAAIGVTKDTVARALVTLRSSGVVKTTRVHASDGQSRSGHQLNLPDGISIRRCPNNQDTPTQDNGASPNGEYGLRLDKEYTVSPNRTCQAHHGNADNDKNRSATRLDPEDDDPPCCPADPLRTGRCQLS
jgi:hypothetical protein